MICSIVRPSAQGGKKTGLLRSTGNTGHSIKEQRAVDANSFETFYIKDQIARCEDTEELRKVILPMIRTQQDQWIRKINEIVKTSGYSKSGFAELCGVSRVTLDKWLKGSITKNRETFFEVSRFRFCLLYNTVNNIKYCRFVKRSSHCRRSCFIVER